MFKEINAIDTTGATVLQDAVRQVTSGDSQGVVFFNTCFEKPMEAVCLSSHSTASVCLSSHSTAVV